MPVVKHLPETVEANLQSSSNGDWGADKFVGNKPLKVLYILKVG